jgi:polysaccharide pyruvyl transferase WcaK-like protein
MSQGSARVRIVAPHIVIFNVKFSPNLGDGIIAECLEHALREQFPGATVSSVDLAGRQSWTAAQGGRSRAALLAMLDHMPRWCRDTVVMAVLGRRVRGHLLPAWRRSLERADLVVFGGGQLIQDGDLNFPLKLAAAASECHRRGLPLAIFAVGAARSTSKVGHSLLSQLLRSPDCIHLAARDAQSVANLATLECSARSCRDPGLLASQLWPAPARPRRGRPLVGICVTHPAVLRHHSDRGSRSRGADAVNLYGAMLRQLVADGYDVVCFSNGAAEDELTLSVVMDRVPLSEKLGRQVTFASRSADPGELARLIARFDVLVAHRLHAAIVAYSYGIPSVGLFWDSKLAAFFTSVNRSDHVASFDEESARSIGGRVRAALAEGVDRATHARVLYETSDAIERLARDLMAALDPARQVGTARRGALPGREPAPGKLSRLLASR